MIEAQLNREKKFLTVLLGGVAWIFLCSLTIADPDLWGHTLYGIRAIDQGVLVERADPFSYTAGGNPWINHEWATEYELGWLWSRFGNSGLLAWKFSILAVLIGLVSWSLVRSESNLGARMILLVFSTLCLGNFAVFIRPQLLTFLLFPLFLWILNQCWSCWTAVVWLLPGLTMIWVNHHGGFLAGIALVVFYGLLAWVRYGLTRAHFDTAIRLSGVGLACMAATCVTPYGTELHQMLWIHLGTEQHVSEWQSVWDVGFSWVYVAPFLILSFAIVIHREWRWIDLLVLLVIALQALSHLRHIALLCLAELVLLPPILSVSVRRVFPQLCQRWVAPGYRGLRWASVLAAIGFLLLLQVQAAVPLWKSGLKPWEIAVETERAAPGMPVRAIRFLRDQGVRGNILTDYGWAQFVIWQTFPDSKIGFDGRYRTVYSAQLERDFLAFQRSGTDRPLQTPFLDEYPTDIVLLPNRSKVLGYLNSRPDWLQLYCDSQATVYIRKDFLTPCQFSGMRLELPEKEKLSWEIFPGAQRIGTKIAE